MLIIPFMCPFVSFSQIILFTFLTSYESESLLYITLKVLSVFGKENHDAEIYFASFSIFPSFTPM